MVPSSAPKGPKTFKVASKYYGEGLQVVVLVLLHDTLEGANPLFDANSCWDDSIYHKIN